METSELNNTILEQKLADALNTISEQNTKIAHQEAEIQDMKQKTEMMTNELTMNGKLVDDLKTQIQNCESFDLIHT